VETLAAVRGAFVDGAALTDEPVGMSTGEVADGVPAVCELQPAAATSATELASQAIMT